MKKLFYLILVSFSFGNAKGQTFYSALCNDYKFAHFIEKNGSLTEAKSKKYQDQHDLALCYLFVQDAKKAMTAFDKLQSNYAEKFNDEDRFYFGLTALRNGNVDLAKSLIGEAKNNGYAAAQNAFYKGEVTESFWKVNFFNQILADSAAGNCNLVLTQDAQGRFLGLFSDNSDKILQQKRSAVFDQPFYSLNTAVLGVKENTIQTKKVSSIKLDKLHRVNSHYQPSQYWPNENKFIFTENAEKQNFRNERVLKTYAGFIDKNQNVRRVPLNINNDSFSISSFVISPNGKIGLFASNGFSSMGMSDLFLCDVINFTTSQFEVGNVRPIGNQINTSLRDNFPWFLNDSVVVFSSEGHWGRGGLDLFQYCLTTGQFARLPEPFNSNADDFGFSSAGDYTVVSSNREAGIYRDKVYSSYSEAGRNNGFSPFQVEQAMDVVQQFIVSVDPKTNEPINSNSLFQEIPDKSIPVGSNKNGYWVNPDQSVEKLPISDLKQKIVSSPNTKVLCKTEPGYYKQIVAISENSVVSSKIPVTMEKINKKDELGAERGIGPVYFDLDKYDLDAEDKRSLDQLAQFLKENSNIQVEIRSHTDSRASREYNIQLSQRRSKSVQNYLVKVHGFSKSRFVLTWVGETQLAEKCPDGVNCDEFKHSLNRRSTFHVLSDSYTEKMALENTRYASASTGSPASAAAQSGSSKKSSEKSRNIGNQRTDNSIGGTTSGNSTVQSEQGVVYRIQFKLSAEQIRTQRLQKESGLSDIYQYEHNGYFKYCTGKFNSKTEADAEVVKMRAGQFKDCFTVKFVDGKRVD